MELPKSTPTSGLFSEIGILPVQLVIEMRQLMFIEKRLLPGIQVIQSKKEYLEMIKCPSENNWPNNVLDLRRKYSLLKKDFNVNNLTWPHWKVMVKNHVKRFAFLTLSEKSLANRNTKHLWYSKLGIQPYITRLGSETARIVFKARLSMCEIMVNFKKMYESDFSFPFCKIEHETFDHIFSCSSVV